MGIIVKNYQGESYCLGTGGFGRGGRREGPLGEGGGYVNSGHGSTKLTSKPVLRR